MGTVKILLGSISASNASNLTLSLPAPMQSRLPENEDGEGAGDCETALRGPGRNDAGSLEQPKVL